MRRPGALLVLVAILALCGCSDAGSFVGETGPTVGPRPEAVAVLDAGEGPESTIGVAASDAPEKGVEFSGPFSGTSRDRGGSGLDADTLLAVRHGVHDGYERVVLDLGVGGEPADAVPRWEIVHPKNDARLRVELPSTTATAVSDGSLGDGLLTDFHVVRAPDGGMFVDISSRKTFRHRALELADPARLVVDFETAGGPPARPQPATGSNTVLLEPRPGARVSDPLTLSGYSRHFEATNTVTFENAEGRTLLRETVTSNDWSSTWGYFEATLDLPPFSGRGTLRVGTESPRDNSFEGVEVVVSRK